MKKIKIDNIFMKRNAIFYVSRETLCGEINLKVL